MLAVPANAATVAAAAAQNIAVQQQQQQQATTAPLSQQLITNAQGQVVAIGGTQVIYYLLSPSILTFIALTLLAVWQEGHLTCKKTASVIHRDSFSKLVEEEKS